MTHTPLSQFPTPTSADFTGLIVWDLWHFVICRSIGENIALTDISHFHASLVLDPCPSRAAVLCVGRKSTSRNQCPLSIGCSGRKFCSVQVLAYAKANGSAGACALLCHLIEGRPWAQLCQYCLHWGFRKEISGVSDRRLLWLNLEPFAYELCALQLSCSPSYESSPAARASSFISMKGHSFQWRICGPFILWNEWATIQMQGLPVLVVEHAKLQIGGSLLC